MLFTTLCKLIPIIVFTVLFAICSQSVVKDHYKRVLWASNTQCVPLMDNSCDVVASYFQQHYLEN